MSKGQQTRQRILARAADVFNTRGFAGTSMADLTRETGIEKGGIYNHFASKEALALEAFDYATELVTQRLQAALAGQEHAIDRLLAIIAVFRSIVEAPPLSGGCPVLNTAVEADDTAPALRERAETAMSGWLRLIGSTVKGGMARGELHPATDPRQVATVVVATLEGAIMLSKLYADPVHMQRAADHLTVYVRSLAQ